MTKTTMICFITGVVALVLSMLFGSGCGPTPTSRGGIAAGGTVLGEATGEGGGPGGHGTVTIDLSMGAGATAGTGGNVGTSSGTAPEQTCGTTTVDTRRAEADVLIVLDRSSSMTSSMVDDSDCRKDDPGCTTRLQAVVSGVQAVVANNPGIRWGLELFTTPKKAMCIVSGPPQVEVGPTSAAAIASQLATLTTASSTPTAAAISLAIDYLKTVADGNNKVILLATDGIPNCADGTTDSDGMPGTLDAVRAARAAGFLVYVIGIGPEVGKLNELAKNGGTGSYYPATSPAELNSALSSIATKVSATCSYKVGQAPPDKGLVYVYVDKTYVARDESDGWIVDAADPTGATVTLTGTYCSKMLAGATSQVQIVFGCPNVPPDRVIP